MIDKLTDNVTSEITAYEYMGGVEKVFEWLAKTVTRFEHTNWFVVTDNIVLSNHFMHKMLDVWADMGVDGQQYDIARTHHKIKVNSNSILFLDGSNQPSDPDFIRFHALEGAGSIFIGDVVSNDVLYNRMWMRSDRPSQTRRSYGVAKMIKIILREEI